MLKVLFPPTPSILDLCQPLGEEEDAIVVSAVTQDHCSNLLDLIEDCLERPERFVLAHTDFGPQDVLVDPEAAKLTGIIHWNHSLESFTAAVLLQRVQGRHHSAHQDSCC